MYKLNFISVYLVLVRRCVVGSRRGPIGLLHVQNEAAVWQLNLVGTGNAAKAHTKPVLD